MPENIFTTKLFSFLFLFNTQCGLWKYEYKNLQTAYNAKLLKNLRCYKYWRNLIGGEIVPLEVFIQFVICMGSCFCWKCCSLVNAHKLGLNIMPPSFFKKLWDSTRYEFRMLKSLLLRFFRTFVRDIGKKLLIHNPPRNFVL